MKKKIIFVITKSNWGGAQRYVYDLATKLPESEFDVCVALGGAGSKDAKVGKLEEKLRLNGIRTIFIKSFMRDISIFKEFAAFFELISILRHEKPDIVHLNSSKAGGTGALAARLCGVRRIIFTSHGWAFNENRSLFVITLIEVLQWITVLFSHKTVCVSRFDADQVKHWPLVAKKISVVHNGITPMTLGTGEVIRSAFPKGVSITGTIGELTRNKNQEVLIEEAMRDSSMYVAIVGEGEDRKMLEERIKSYNLEDRVKLFGFISADEALKGFDKFTLPSIKEGLPYVLLEAKQAGLPIIANRVGGIGEILDNEDPEEFTLDRMLRKTIEVYNNQ